LKKNHRFFENCKFSGLYSCSNEHVGQNFFGLKKCHVTRDTNLGTPD
jgi:hypothetical protein